VHVASTKWYSPWHTVGVLMDEKSFLSIGEVLGLLLDEFPDVTISKIRFLESQGLIEPERTPSGYRKFNSIEIDRLKFILREQRENYLPLKVIRNRLESDTSDGMIRPYEDTNPRGIRNVSPASHPAASKTFPQAPAGPRNSAMEKDTTASINRQELLQVSTVDEAVLKQLVAAGLVTPKKVGDMEMFSANDREVVEIGAKFVELGIDVRHLKSWKHSAEREVSLFEQRILPFLRQRNPAAREQAVELLGDLIELGEQLRAALVAAAAKPYIEGQ
jgi:DNA-binding transcriptional MerR regulator